MVLAPSEVGINSVGSVTVSTAGISLAKIEATANARDEIARSMNVKIMNMIKNFTETIGVGDEQTVDKVLKERLCRVGSDPISKIVILVVKS